MSQVNKSIFFFLALKNKTQSNQIYLKKKREERTKNQENFYYLTE